jgi:Anti-sigma factor NepR
MRSEIDTHPLPIPLPVKADPDYPNSAAGGGSRIGNSFPGGRVVPTRRESRGKSGNVPTQPPPPSSLPRPLKVPEKPGSKLTIRSQVEIGRALRDAYADVAEEPVPNRFVRLLEALEAKETNG